MTMKPALQLIVLIGALGLAAAAPASQGMLSGKSGCQRAERSLAAATHATAVRTYDDYIEDAGAAPDFCAANLITNDNRSVTIGIHVHNRSGLGPNDVYGVLFDADGDPTTGASGVEFLLTFDTGGPQLSRWSGTSFDVLALQEPIVIDWLSGYGPVLQVNRSDLGDPARLNFVLVSVNGDDADRAPDADAWSYELTPLELKIASLSLGRARAGRPLVAKMLVTRSDFGSELREGSIRCPATLAGKRLGGRGGFLRDRATCTWQLPKSARGKRLAGSVAVSFQGVEVKRAFSVTVR